MVLVGEDEDDGGDEDEEKDEGASLKDATRRLGRKGSSAKLGPVGPSE